MYNKILLAVDELTNSLRAVEKVIKLQKNCNCKVIMIHSIIHPRNITLRSIYLPSGGDSYYLIEKELIYHAIEEGTKILLNMEKKLIMKI